MGLASKLEAWWRTSGDGLVRCHVCGYQLDNMTKCPECGHRAVKHRVRRAAALRRFGRPALAAVLLPFAAFVLVEIVYAIVGRPRPITRAHMWWDTVLMYLFYLCPVLGFGPLVFLVNWNWKGNRAWGLIKASMWTLAVSFVWLFVSSYVWICMYGF